MPGLCIITMMMSIYHFEDPSDLHRLNKKLCRMGITIHTNLFGEYVAFVEESRMKQIAVHISKKRKNKDNSLGKKTIRSKAASD